MKKLMMLLFPFLLLQSCSYITVLRTRELNAVRDSLALQIAALDKKNSGRQQKQDELLRLIRADQQLRFSEVKMQIAEIGSSLSETQYRMSKIYENTSDVQKQLEARLAADSAAATTQSSEPEYAISCEDLTSIDAAVHGRELL
jgi:septal ring factor EnvC (AmiA/AmiB activator)